VASDESSAKICGIIHELINSTLQVAHAIIVLLKERITGENSIKV
jgi:hypothetical protein